MIDVADYTEQALRTEASGPVLLNSLHRAVLRVLVAAGALADVLKKDVIYGRGLAGGEYLDAAVDLNLAHSDLLTQIGPYSKAMAGHYVVGHEARLLHAAVGLFGESAELIDAWSRLGTDNIVEEAGDALWYQALLLDAVDGLTGVSPAGVARGNLAKLRARFPDKFDVKLSNERDVAAEISAMTRSAYPREEDDGSAPD